MVSVIYREIKLGLSLHYINNIFNKSLITYTPDIYYSVLPDIRQQYQIVSVVQAGLQFHMGRLTPTITTIKKLFALSGNECAYNFNGENCSNKIIDKDNDIIGELCHIEAANEGWPRYNQYSNDEYRRDCENLILLCPIHHKKVDKNPSFTVEVLK